MNKREQLEDYVSEYEECDSECGECRLSNYVTILDTDYILCSIISEIYNKAIDSFKKENHIK